MWPRMYSTTKAERDVMSQDERDAIWAEYQEYWKGFEGHDNKPPKMDQEGNDYGQIKWGIAQTRVGD